MRMLSSLLILLFVEQARSTLRRAHTLLNQQEKNQPFFRTSTCHQDVDCSFPNGECLETTVKNSKRKECLCRSPFAGAKCQNTEKQLLCEPKCEHNAYCNGETRTCQCPSGFVGKACTKKCPTDSGDAVCGNHGDCAMTEEKGAECFCSPGWTGVTCTRKLCPWNTNGGECSGNGKCVDGACDCVETFVGPSCSERSCNIDCSGHGTCIIATQTCKCGEGWYGKNCELKICPSTRFGVCGGHGMCDDKIGVCTCDGSWTGGACHVPRCVVGNDVDCSGHGRCRGDKCHCALGWAGEACQKQVCPMGCLSAAGRGSCVGGKCECSPGFLGEACESKEPVPLACGAPCHTKCLSLPEGGNSADHCEQVAPIDISMDGTFPKVTKFVMKKISNDFPGFKCYQRCYSKCLQGCFDQMHPMMASTFAKKH